MSLVNDNTLFLLEEIVKKNFAAKYKGSVLGILWSVLKPLLIMILLTIIFSNLFGGSIDNYPVYFLSGKCIFDFFTAATNVSMMSLKGNINILKRTAAPKFVFTLGGVISEFINFIITLIILIGVMIVTKAPFHSYMILNPVFWVIDQFRLLVLWGTIPSRMNMINLVLLSAIILVLGVIVFKRYEKKLTLKF